MLFLLQFFPIISLSPIVFSDAKFLIRGKVYARMELCQQPRVTVQAEDNVLRNSSPSKKDPTPKATAFSSVPPTRPAETPSKTDHFFHIDLSNFPSMILQIKAECPPTERDQSPLAAKYSLDTATIDWKGAHELLLFNDVSVLAFAYTKDQ